MTAEAVLAIGIVVSSVSQLIKKYSPVEGRQILIVSALLSLLCVIAWGITYENAVMRQLIWPYIAAWVAVTVTATGVYEVVSNASDVIKGKPDVKND